MACGSSMEERQLAYLLRGQGAAQTTWRGLPLHRLASRKFILFADNQIRTSTPFCGLKHFVKDPERFEWGHWSRYPGIGLAGDGEAANLNAVNYLMWHIRANTWFWYDQPHGVKTGLEGFLKDMGWWDFALLLLLGWYCEFGARNDEDRFQQIRKIQDKVLAKPYTEVPLFLSLAPCIISQLETYGDVCFPREQACCYTARACMNVFAT